MCKQDSHIECEALLTSTSSAPHIRFALQSQLAMSQCLVHAPPLLSRSPLPQPPPPAAAAANSRHYIYAAAGRVKFSHATLL